MAPKRESIAVNLPQSRNAETEMPSRNAEAGSALRNLRRRKKVCQSGMKNLPKQEEIRAERKKHCEICAERMNGGKLRKTIFGGKT